jgi:hypothetical protein
MPCYKKPMRNKKIVQNKLQKPCGRKKQNSTQKI